jgi:hypothetical protein
VSEANADTGPAATDRTMTALNTPDSILFVQYFALIAFVSFPDFVFDLTCADICSIAVTVPFGSTGLPS